MNRLSVVAPAIVLCVFACAEPDVEDGAPPSGRGAPARILPPEAPEIDPPPRGKELFAGLENRTEEEERARASRDRLGVAAIRAVDAGTGEPVTDQQYYGCRFALKREDVDRRLHTEVDWMDQPPVPDGVRRHDLAEGWWRLRLEADGYRNTWTPRFRVERGKTTEFTVRMLRANRLLATVLEPDGSPCADGTLIIRERDRLGARPVKDGVVDALVHDDEVTIAIDPRFMEGYRAWSRKVEMSYGTTTRVTVRLRK
jgi:hypothetical protein